MVYMPVILPVLRGLGILEKVMDNAFLNHEGAFWRTPQGVALAHLEVTSDTPEEFGGILLIGRSKMNSLVLDEIKKYRVCRSVLGRSVLGLRMWREQRKSKLWHISSWTSK
jgi:hypothetical protein